MRNAPGTGRGVGQSVDVGKEVAARRVVTLDNDFNGPARPTTFSPPIDNVGRKSAASNEIGAVDSEKPDALAGATGLEFEDWLSWVDNNLQRESKARALAHAIVECDPDDRLEFIELVHEFFSAGFPTVLLGSVMEAAVFWADRASRTERKAYCLACFNRLSASDKAAFLQHVQPPVGDA